tara:strand:- start:269 stop:1411 length:1143 start_codon:yes stop_codon:yes gene_type:complete
MKSIKNILKSFLSFLLSPLKIIPLKKNVIIIQSTNPNSYSNNPRYLYEFLSKKKLNVYWFCQNKKVEDYLKKRNFKFISIYNPLKLIFIALKARVIIDGGSNYFNFLNLIPDTSKKIHIGHGAANKMVLHKFYDSNDADFYFKKFDYINFPSKFTINEVAKKIYKLSNKKIVKLGYPKFEELKIKNKSNKKKNKVIFYTPTWRPYKYPLPLINLKNFNLKDFKIFLKKNNIKFIYSRHSINSNFQEDKIADNENIFFIDNEKFPLFDTTKFLKKIDLLINDCSSTSIESLFINVPQINIFPDLKKYNRESGFLKNYEENLTGPFVHDYENFKKYINLYLKKSNYYKKKFLKKNIIEKNRYYDMYNQNSNYLCLKFIKSLL